jgi:hypothetical protein
LVVRGDLSYRSALVATVSASAAPYGYTLTIWTTGAVLAHARGIPSAPDALLFLVGAVLAYGLVAAVAVRGMGERYSASANSAAIWGGLHVFSVGLAIGAVAAVAHYVGDVGAWPLGGFLATAIYLLGSATQLTVAHASRGRR